MSFEWIIDATKWSLIGGAFIFGVSAYTKTKQLAHETSQPIGQIKTDYNFSLPNWLTGFDLIKTFEISEDQLKQHILDGLPAYDVDDSVYWGADVKKPINIETEFLWFEDKILELRFKKIDIEKYVQKNT